MDAAGGHGGAPGLTTTPSRRRPRPEPGEDEGLFIVPPHASHHDHAPSGRRVRRRTRRAEGTGLAEDHEEEDEEEEDIIQWLLGNTRGSPLSAEIDYTTFHRLSFRDKVRPWGLGPV